MSYIAYCFDKSVFNFVKLNGRNKPPLQDTGSREIFSSVQSYYTNDTSWEFIFYLTQKNFMPLHLPLHRLAGSYVAGAAAVLRSLWVRSLSCSTLRRWNAACIDERERGVSLCRLSLPRHLIAASRWHPDYTLFLEAAAPWLRCFLLANIPASCVW